MTNKQWKNSFRTYTGTEFKWDGVTEHGHCRKFEELVSENPEKYLQLIEEIIEDLTIPQSYVIYGLQGLEKGKFNPHKTKELFFRCLQFRKGKLEREYLLYLIWLTAYFIREKIADAELVRFLINLINTYPDTQKEYTDPLAAGINTIRGAAIDR